MKLILHKEMREEDYYARYRLALTDNLFLVLPGVKQTLQRDKVYEYKRSLMLSPCPEEAAAHSRWWVNEHNKMSICVSVTPYAVLSEVPADHPIGLHASVALPHRLPTWEEYKAVKEAVFGDDMDAMQILPRKEIYYNYHPFCLHLWETPFIWEVRTP